MHSTADSTEPKPVMMTTSGLTGRVWISLSKSVPSPSGRRTSRKTTSKLSLFRYSRAAEMVAVDATS